MRFTKMHGAGNDFVLIDGDHGGMPADASRLARRVCARRDGVGADGLVIMERKATPVDVDARMVVWNADGSRADMCGNALRCVARWLVEFGGSDRGPGFRIATDSGVQKATITDVAGETWRVATTVGVPEFDRATIPMVGPSGVVVNEPFEVDGRTLTITALRLGNPHCVVWTEDVGAVPVDRLGPLIETHPAFPARVNVEFVQVIAADRVRQRTWERGCGETSACGTGAAAVCVAGGVADRTPRAITVGLRGGDLDLSWPSDDAEVRLTGPAHFVLEGTLPWR